MKIELNDNEISTLLAALDHFVRANGLNGASKALGVSQKIVAARQAEKEG